MKGVIFLYMVNFFPIFPFTCQFELVLYNLIQTIENVRRFANLCKDSQNSHEDFHWCWSEITGKKLLYFDISGEGHIETGQYVYICCKMYVYVYFP